MVFHLDPCSSVTVVNDGALFGGSVTEPCEVDFFVQCRVHCSVLNQS